MSVAAIANRVGTWEGWQASRGRDVCGWSSWRLRPDVALHDGPRDDDGSPTFVLHDPAAGRYERLTWAQAMVLSTVADRASSGGEWDGEAIADELWRSTTLRLEASQVDAMLADMAARGLLVRRADAGAAAVGDAGLDRAAAGRGGGSIVQWVLQHALYVRIPLCDPDAWLVRLLPWVKPLASRWAWLVYGVLAVYGVVSVVQQFDVYMHTAIRTLTWRHAGVYALGLFFVKLVHELAHGLTAKSMGVRTPSMGVALIVGAPVAYTDVTDSWRLGSRRSRMWISGAGVLSEVVLAGIGLAVWAAAADGPVRSAAFIVSSIGFLSTILVNLNPAMRYDGYYVLSDLMRVDNLQPRAFRLARWWLYRWLLGMETAHPEARMQVGRARLLLWYAFGAIMYRVVLFVSISAMLMWLLPRPIGLAAAAAELGLLLGMPIVREVKGAWRLRRSWRPRLWGVGTAGLLIVLLIYAAAPLPRRVSAPAVTVCPMQQVHVPHAGVLTAVHVKPGQRVEAGEVLCELASPWLEARLRQVSLAREALEIEMRRSRSDASGRTTLLVQAKEALRLAAEASRLRRAKAGSVVRASISGTVVEWDERYRPGAAVGPHVVLGRIMDASQRSVEVYFDAGSIGGVSASKAGVFVGADGSAPVGLRLAGGSAVEVSALARPALASVYGGPIDTVLGSDGRTLKVVESRYRVVGAFVSNDRVGDVRIGQRGSVWVWSKPRSHFVDAGRWVWRRLLRETAF